MLATSTFHAIRGRLTLEGVLAAKGVGATVVGFGAGNSGWSLPFIVVPLLFDCLSVWLHFSDTALPCGAIALPLPFNV